jgi:nucleotide-binding universal stress UspA family protein
MQPPDGAPLAAPDPLGWEIGRQQAQAYLDRIREQVAALGPRTDVVLAQGDPAKRIVTAAVELRADLTVLGSHGQDGRTGGLLGSTAQQVLAVSRGSVFVTRSAPEAGVDVARRILVPLDGSTRTECVLPTVARIARIHGAEVVLVHVVSEPVSSTILSAGEDLELARDLARRLVHGAERYLATIASQLALEGIAVRTIVLREVDARQALVELCDQEQIDLTVVAAHGSTCNPSRPFGTVASYMLSLARPALLLIQDLPRDVAWGLEDEHHAEPIRGTAQTGPSGAT